MVSQNIVAPFNVRIVENMLKLVVVFILVVCMFDAPIVVYADGSLTEIFTTKAFQGSWEVLNKFNWLGWLLNFAISAFCLIGLVMTLYQRLISILYLSNRPLFDQIYDLKQIGKGSNFFGFSNMGREIYKGNQGTGLDMIVGIFYALMPNVKAYSDYNPERMTHNLSEDDNALTYMLKTALPTVVIIFLFTIGFSGTLAKSYATVVNGMAAAADKAVEINLETYVNKLFSTGESYSFTLGANNSADGKLAEKISRDIYGKVLSRMSILDTNTRLEVGKNVESWVWNEVLGGAYGLEGGYRRLEELAQRSSSGANNAITVSSEADVKALKYELVVNTNRDLGNNSGLVASMRDTFLGGLNVTTPEGGVQDFYVHLIVRKDKVSEANFFITGSGN